MIDKENKPDFENESFKAWVGDKKDFREKHPLYIEIDKKIKIQLIGYDKYFCPKRKIIEFAYKIRHDNRLILYYFDENINEDKKNKTLKGLYELSNIIGYDLINSREQVKSMVNEIHVLKKLKKNKKAGNTKR